jgi:hypothetical protein
MIVLRQRRKDAVAHAKIGRAEMRSLFRFGQSQSQASNGVCVHGGWSSCNPSVARSLAPEDAA